MLEILNQLSTGYGGFLLWCLIWSLGGIFLVQGAFKLKKDEILVVGVASGIVIESWIANLLGHFLEPLKAFWLAALVTLVVGILFCVPLFRKRIRFKELFPFVPWQWITFFVLFYLFFMIARGMSIWDEFKTLPLVSMIASGDIPPHFPYDISTVLDEHYLRYLIAAQFMRIGDFYPWTSLAILKALTLSLGTVLVVVWVKKITKNIIAGISGGVLHVLGGGTRWLLLLLPPSVIDQFDSAINRIGSGLNSGADLRTALISPWAAQGMAPIPIPFAFTNGLIKPSILGVGWDNVTFLILIVVILLYNKAKDWKALSLLGVLLASMALMDELTFAFISGILIVIHFVQIVKKDAAEKKESRTRLLLLLAVWIVVFLQGGFFTSIARNVFEPAYTSYHSFQVSFNFPPRFMNPHLGELILTDPIHLVVLLLECGPLLFVFPFVLKWGWKSYKNKRYIEAAYIGTSLIGLAFCFVQIVSKGINSAVNRVQNDFLEVSLLFAVPVLFFWLQNNRNGRKVLVFMMALITIFGGVVVMGTELSAVQEPQLSLFITDMDVRMMDIYWNRLEKDAVVMDPNIPRAITIFARTGNSSIDFYAPTEEWQRMVYDPDPHEMAVAGYDYMYYDLEYWKTLTGTEQELLTSQCVIPVNEESDWTGDFRILVDISQCRQDGAVE
ncbi:MAG TPA: hypothetical protein DCK95_01315 [Anaerolineaceae bacterium]|nr:hypothetical protein [Anaerolineaceae bacterium]